MIAVLGVKLENMMEVTCELEFGNNETHAGKTLKVCGNPLGESGFIHLCIGDDIFEVRPSDLSAAIQRVRSDA